jgi:hypothetical protein
MVTMDMTSESFVSSHHRCIELSLLQLSTAN